MKFSTSAVAEAISYSNSADTLFTPDALRTTREFRTPNRGQSGTKRRRLNASAQAVRLTPVTGTVALGPRPDIYNLDSVSEKALSVLSKGDIICPIIGVHRKGKITLENYNKKNGYREALEDNVKKNSERYDACCKAEVLARGYNNACKQNVSRIYAAWQEWEAGVEAKRIEFETKHTEALMEQSNWQEIEVKARAAVTVATQNISDSQKYKQELLSMATLPDEEKECADMSKEEIRAVVGVSSPAEVKGMSPVDVLGWVHELRNKGVDANHDVCGDIHAFNICESRGRNVRFALYLRFPLADILETFGFEETLDVASELFGADEAKKLLEEPSHSMLRSKQLEFERLKAKVEAL